MWSLSKGLKHCHLQRHKIAPCANIKSQNPFKKREKAVAYDQKSSFDQSCTKAEAMKGIDAF